MPKLTSEQVEKLLGALADAEVVNLDVSVGALRESVRHVLGEKPYFPFCAFWCPDDYVLIVAKTTQTDSAVMSP